MTTEERAALWASMNAKQRKAFIKNGAGVLGTTSGVRRSGVAAEVKKANGS